MSGSRSRTSLVLVLAVAMLVVGAAPAGSYELAADDPLAVVAPAQATEADLPVVALFHDVARLRLAIAEFEAGLLRDPRPVAVRALQRASRVAALKSVKASRLARRPPPPPPPRPVVAAPVGPIPDDVWDRLAHCESRGNWAHSTGRFHGGLQFHPDTWRRYKLDGYPEFAYEATREQQIAVGKRVQAAQGWRAWPHCSKVLGLR